MKNHALNSSRRSRRGRPGACPPAVILALILMSWMAACQGPREGDAPREAAALVAAQGAGAQGVGEAADWCAGHGLPESMCTKCNPELTARFKAAGDWCGEHGFPESACPSCNPMAPPGAEAAPASGDWCAGHGLPESMCTKCNPELTASFKAAGDWCGEHGFPESACPLCNPMAPPGSGSGAIPPGTVIRFSSPAIEGAAGLQFVPARMAVLGREVEAPAVIGFDEDRLAEIRAPVPGILREVRVRPGQAVSPGEVLFVLESAGVGDLQARRSAALERERGAEASLKRLTGLQAEGVASARQIDEATRERATARAQVAAIDQALGLAGGQGEGGAFTLTAPIGGVVIRRDAVQGSWVEPTHALATVADTARMWARLALAPGDGARIAGGEPLSITVPDLGGEVFSGAVLWVSPELDPRTRTVAVIAELKNPEGRLKANHFGTARVQIERSELALTVPEAAIQRVGEAQVVFVRVAQGRYEPREVEVASAQRGHVQVTGQLQAGEPVVTEGAFLLRTELDRGSIGAGCCEVEASGGR